MWAARGGGFRQYTRVVDTPVWLDYSQWPHAQPPLAFGEGVSVRARVVGVRSPLAGADTTSIAILGGPGPGKVWKRESGAPVLHYPDFQVKGKVFDSWRWLVGFLL